MSELRSKDPDSTVDYTFDWTDWLGGDTITAATVTPDATSGVTVVGTPTWTGGKAVTCWLTGGILGATARVVCHIGTAAGRTEDQTLVLAIRQH